MADFTFITPRLAVGGAIRTRKNLEKLLRAGITHIINTQMEFDDRTLLSPDGNLREPKILWIPIEDDFQFKPFEFFATGVRFALDALRRPDSRVFIHCASGVHRGPLLLLAVLRVLDYGRSEARRLITARRPGADFPDVYRDSVEAFLAEWKIR